MFDIYVFIIVASVGAGLLFPDLFEGTSKTEPGRDQLIGILFLFAYIPVEAFCLYAFGTTLGKALYGITVIPGEKRIAFSQALRRSVLVWFKGLGMGIGIVAIFTQIVAYNNLKRNLTTTWDSDIGMSVTHSKPNFRVC